MRLLILHLIIISHLATFQLSGGEEEFFQDSNHPKYGMKRLIKDRPLSFSSEPYVNPAIIRKLIGPLSDLGPNITAINLDEANDSNEFYSNYSLVHYPTGLQRIRFKNEFRNQWVRQELGNGHYFEYQAVGDSPWTEEETIYLMCREFTGGSQMWIYNLAVKIEEDILLKYNEGGEFKEYTYKKLKYLSKLPKDFFNKKDRFKKMRITFNGYFENKYEIEILFEPWQYRMEDGIDCFATYYITNIETNKQAYFHHYNLHLPLNLVKDHIITEDGFPIEINQEMEEFWTQMSFSPPKIGEQSDDPFKDLWTFFTFEDLDFDGKKEFIVLNSFAGQRMRNAYDVYSLEKLDGEPVKDWDSFMPCPVYELEEMPYPLSYLDDGSIIDLKKQLISLHLSGGAHHSSIEDFSWFDGAPNNGWLLVQESGCDGSDENGNPNTYEYKFKHTKTSDGIWNTEKITLPSW